MKKTFTKLFTTLAFLLIASTMWAQSITFSVDMTAYLAAGGTISPNGVHMTGNFTVPNWTPEAPNYQFTQVGATNVYTITLNTADPAQFLAPATDPEYMFKFINSNAVNFSWGACHIDQECLPSGGSCTNGSNDNRSLGTVGSLPAYDTQYDAMWDSCTGTNFAPLGVNQIHGAIASVSAFPNPAVTNTTISLVLAQSAKNVTLTVYNAVGQVKNQIVRTNEGAGTHNFNINTSDLANGIYLYSVNVDGITVSQKLTVLN